MDLEMLGPLYKNFFTTQKRDGTGQESRIVLQGMQKGLAFHVFGRALFRAGLLSVFLSLLCVTSCTEDTKSKQTIKIDLTQYSLHALGDVLGGKDYSTPTDIVVLKGTVIVVGQSESDHGLEAFRWTAEDGMTGLGFLDGGDFYSKANAISDTGTIVGQSHNAKGRSGFYWTETEGIKPLSSEFGSTALDVSGDNKIIIGKTHKDGEEEHPIIWRAFKKEKKTSRWFKRKKDESWAIRKNWSLSKGRIINELGAAHAISKKRGILLEVFIIRLRGRIEAER